MQNYFKRIERNLYLLPLLNPDHGFDGWLKTNVNPILDLLNPAFLGEFAQSCIFHLLFQHVYLDLQIVDVFAALAISDVPVLDLNSRAGDNAAGVNFPSFTIDEVRNRSSVYQRLLDVQNSKPGRLQFSLETLATKVLLCEAEGGGPKAYGVTIAPGASLPIASAFTGKTELDLKNITVKREVIVSAGTFQSPQLVSAEFCSVSSCPPLMHFLKVDGV